MISPTVEKMLATSSGFKLSLKIVDKTPSGCFFSQLVLVPSDFKTMPSFKMNVLVYLPAASQGLVAS